MDEPYFTRPGEGERVGPRRHRILGELPHLEALELGEDAQRPLRAVCDRLALAGA